VADQTTLRRRPLLCGYYGEHNLGDDALLTALLRQLPPGSDPLVTAFDEGEVRQRFGVRTCPRRSLGAVRRALGGCDALVFGGGSLLQDATSFRSLLYYAALIATARLQGKPVLLWGQGLGPLRRRRSRLLVRRLLPLAQGISWRDSASAALAAGWGIEAPVGSDPVWSLPPRVWQGGGGPIVLCWRPSRAVQGPRWIPLLEAVDELAEASGREVLWLPFHRDQDRGLLRHLQGEGLVPDRLARRSRQVAVSDPDQAMDRFSAAGLVLSMRLHGLILAALSGAPCAALSYDPKVRAAAEGYGCPCCDLEASTTTLDAKPLVRAWSRLLDAPPPPDWLERQRRATGPHAQLLRDALG
jgi:polysaccharide pyruvyl transferase CsaB